MKPAHPSGCPGYYDDCAPDACENYSAEAHGNEAAEVALQARRDRIAVLANQVGRPDEPFAIFPRLTCHSQAGALAAWLECHAHVQATETRARTVPGVTLKPAPAATTLPSVEQLWVELSEIVHAETGDNGGEVVPSERAWIAALANVAARRSRLGGAPRLTDASPRADVVAWLQWCDPNGCHADDLAAAEGCDPYDLDGAWEALLAMAMEGCR